MLHQSKLSCMCLVKLGFIILISTKDSFQEFQQNEWEDEDTVILQASSEIKATEGFRWKRQFPGFPAGWPLGVGGGGGIFGGGIFGQRPPKPVGAAPGQCETRRGESGYCRTTRQCFPVLFDSDDPADMTTYRNPALAEVYLELSTPCNIPIMSNHFYFSADAEARQSMVCCPTQKPWYPPAIQKQTTTTTRRPFTHLTLRTSTWRPTQRLTTSTSSTTYRPWWSTQRPQGIGGVGGHRPPKTTTTSTSTTTRPPYLPPAPAPAPARQVCGVNLKIVGGHMASPGNYPWLVSIVRDHQHLCGGSLIDSQHVLTAAHCFDQLTSYHVGQLRVLFGDHDLSTTTEARHEVRKIKKVAKHRGFDRVLLRNDIALFQVDKPIEISPRTRHISPVCLAGKEDFRTQRYDQGNTQGIVAGWGGTQFGKPVVSVLRHVTMPIWTNADCKRRYGNLAPGGINPDQVCAGSKQFDSCSGDSGGPLMIHKSGEPVVQIGIVSWGIRCGDYPGVYTRVDHFRDWIDKNQARLI